MKKLSILVASVIVLTGCTEAVQTSDVTSESVVTSVSTVQTTTTTAASSASTTTNVSTTTTTYLEKDDIIPEAIQTPKIEGDRLSYTIINIYSEGEYYTMEVSGIKMDDTSTENIDTTYIGDELYGDFRIDLLRDGEVLDSHKINVPRDDRFLILESVADGRTYGCELISHKREYNINTYPDLLRLDFHIINEVETPQYARYFAVYGQDIVEIPVYENGVEAAPHGTHLDFESEGVFTQYVVESDSRGNYFVQMYRYTFDKENRCFTRKKVNY